MTTYTCHVPIGYDNGPYRITCSASLRETKEQNALWQHNKSREHDGLPPVKRMPRGTVYTRNGRAKV